MEIKDFTISEIKELQRYMISNFEYDLIFELKKQRLDEKKRALEQSLNVARKINALGISCASFDLGGVIHLTEEIRKTEFKICKLKIKLWKKNRI